MRLLAPLLLTALSAAGCASPETLDSTPVQILAAVPGLTYVDGDPEAGTTTVVSLPLLTFRSSEQGEDFHDSSTWVLPLLGRFAQNDRYATLEWVGQPEGSQQASEDEAKAQGPPEDEPPEEPPAEKKPRGGVTLAEPAGEPKRARGGVTVAGPRAERAREARREREERRRQRRRSLPRRERRPAGEESKARRRPPKAAVVRREGALVLQIDAEGEIVRQRPLQRTEWDLLASLIRHHSTRPAQVVVKTKEGHRRRTAVYDLGETRDEFRILPLFSYHRDSSSTGWVAWPLLGFGYGREGEDRFLRLFYFLKIPLN